MFFNGLMMVDEVRDENEDIVMHIVFNNRPNDVLRVQVITRTGMFPMIKLVAFFCVV